MCGKWLSPRASVRRKSRIPTEYKSRCSKKHASHSMSSKETRVSLQWIMSTHKSISQNLRFEFGPFWSRRDCVAWHCNGLACPILIQVKTIPRTLFCNSFWKTYFLKFFMGKCYTGFLNMTKVLENHQNNVMLWNICHIYIYIPILITIRAGGLE